MCGAATAGRRVLQGRLRWAIEPDSHYYTAISTGHLDFSDFGGPSNRQRVSSRTSEPGRGSTNARFDPLRETFGPPVRLIPAAGPRGSSSAVSCCHSPRSGQYNGRRSPLHRALSQPGHLRSGRPMHAVATVNPARDCVKPPPDAPNPRAMRTGHPRSRSPASAGRPPGRAGTTGTVARPTGNLRRPDLPPTQGKRSPARTKGQRKW